MAKWNYKRAKKDALRFNTLKKWESRSGSFTFAKKNNLIERFSKHMKPKFFWTKELVRKKALQYKTKKEWSQDCLGSYGYAVRHGLLKELSKHMVRSKRTPNEDFIRVFKVKKWNLELVKKESLKYQSITEWKSKSGGSFAFARRKKILKELTSHMIPCRTQWSRKRCFETTLKYKLYDDWAKFEKNAMKVAQRKGWLKYCSRNLIKTSNPRGFWHKKNNLIKEMKKYKTRRQFHLENAHAYVISLKKFPEVLDKYLPIIQSSNTSLGEHSTKIFLEKVFKFKFIKKRHDFLKNPKTGFNLELDGYCKELKLAFEYGNHKDLHSKRGTIDYLKNILIKDKFKIKRCKEEGIKLIQITIDSISLKNPSEHLKQQIKEQLILSNVPIPKHYDDTPLDIVQFKGEKWTKAAIWRAVKNSKNITDLQIKYGPVYKKAQVLGILKNVQDYFHRKNKTKQRKESRRRTRAELALLKSSKKIK